MLNFLPIEMKNKYKNEFKLQTNFIFFTNFRHSALIMYSNKNEMKCWHFFVWACTLAVNKRQIKSHREQLFSRAWLSVNLKKLWIDLRYAFHASLFSVLQLIESHICTPIDCFGCWYVDLRLLTQRRPN